MQPFLVPIFARPSKPLKSAFAKAGISQRVRGITLARVNAHASLPYVEVVVLVDYHIWFAKGLQSQKNSSISLYLARVGIG